MASFYTEAEVKEYAKKISKDINFPHCITQQETSEATKMAESAICSSLSTIAVVLMELDEISEHEMNLIVSTAKLTAVGSVFEYSKCDYTNKKDIISSFQCLYDQIDRFLKEKIWFYS